VLAIAKHTISGRKLWGSFAIIEHINASTKDMWRTLASMGDI
jgi:hypothetical protein